MTAPPIFVWSVFVLTGFNGDGPALAAGFGFNPALDDFLAFICSSSP